MKSLNAVLIGSLLFISMNLAAQTIPPVVSVKYLNTLTTVPSSFTVTENEMNTEVTAGPPIPFKDKAVHNYVKLAIDPGKDDFISAGVEYKVDVEIKFWNVNGTFTGFTNTTINKTLKINYSPDNSALITDINLYSFQDAYKIQVKVTQVYVNGSAYTSYSSLPNCLYIEAGIEVERYYDFDYAASPDDLEVVYDEDYQYLNVQNFSVSGAVAYEIEWTYVNNYGSSLASNLTPSELTYTFHNNSSRIRVNSDEIIKIPAVFDRGYVIVRARGIGRTGPNLDKDWYGPWTITDNYDDDLSDPYSVNTLIATTYIVEIGVSGDQPVFESNKNWMYQVTFAEEGKMKHIISYFDGTSRNRQSVTVVNTDNEAIVAETFYDHQGRAVAQSLPVPVDRDLVGSDYVPNKHLNYYENFNLSAEGTPVKFNRLNFDIDGELACEPVQVPFSNTSGAGKYYSPNNQIQNKHNAFIPDAEGYAYTLTEFMPDNTGRVRRQTGVGPDHNLNSDHYTSYFYGKPFQEELDRLFGTNVGDAAHYQKNMIIDPNGQVSVSYLDMKGNVIATALAGEAPGNVQSLKVDGTGGNLYESVLDTQTIDLLDVSGEDAHGSNNELSDDGMTYSMYAPILVTSESDYTFLYSVEEKEYLEECLSAVCFDCVFDIDITLLDLCGNPAGHDGIDIHQMVGDMPLSDGSGTSLECEESGEFSLSGSTMIAESVPTGLYYLNKNLSINTEALETYANLYIQELEAIENPEVDVYSAVLDGPGSDGIEDALQDADHDGIIGEEANCFMTFEEFYHTALENVDISDCDISCDDCAIVQNQTLSEFIIAHTVSETPEEAAALEESYNEALAFCDAMCSSPGNDFCLMAKNMMLADMSPGGQYAQYINEVDGTVSEELYPLSVLNSVNRLQLRTFGIGGQSTWKTPVRKIGASWLTGYYNEDGSDRTKILVTGTGADMNPPTIAPFTGLDGNTYTYPENLIEVEDFIELFQSSWAQSLIAYHPEYYYYEDCLELYTTDEDITITETVVCNDCNTFQYDEFLLGINVEDLEESDLAILINNDPFFVNYSLEDKDDFDYKYIDGLSGYYSTDCLFDIYQFAWISANSTPAFYDFDCSDLETEMGATGWDIISNDLVWPNFVLTYISAKYQFWLEHADTHADEHNAYHGCIGNEYNFQYESDVVTPFDDIEELWEDDYVCGLPQGVFLSEKVSRFPDVNQEFGIDGEDLEAELDELLDDADIAYFEATGNEPLAYDLELFLSGLLEVAGGWLPTATFDITDILSLTPRLNTELIDLGLTTWNPTFTDITETEIEWGTGPCLTLALPDDTHAFIDILSLHDIHVTNPVTGEFEIIADFAALDPDDDNIEVILTGQYCGSLDASPFPTTDCELSDGAGAVWSVMNAILVNDLGGPTDNFHTTTATSINTISGYDLSSGIKPQLQEYLGETLPYKWKYNSTDDYFSLLSNDLSKSINIYFTTTISTGIDYLKLMEPLAEPDFAGLTNDFTIVSVDGATELGFAGFMEWQWESEIYTFPVGECDFPVELFCNDKENLNRADLEALFAALIEDEDFAPEIGDAVGLETYPEYTDNLEILTGHPTFDDSWNVTFNDGHEMHATFVSYNASVDENIENCFATFNIEDATITDNLDDDDLGELISLTGDYTYTFSDYTYNFILEIETPEVDTIYIQGSTTCIPIKDCDDCHQEITDIYEDYSPSVITVNHTVTTVSTVSVGVAVAGGTTDAASISGTTSFLTIKGIGNNRANRQDTVDVAANTTKKFMMYARYVSTIIDTLYKQTAGGNMKVIARLGDTPPTKPEYTVDEDCMDDLKAYPLVESDNDCIDQQISLAYANALDAYNNYILELKNTFKDNYVSHCMSALETFSMQYAAGEYHYTLYYYDQADNVVMTVPPAGIQFVDESDFDAIDDYRDNVLAAVPVTPMHTLTTRYAYNSLNQLKWQSTPDGGESRFWYDRLGRMVLSQNAKQNKIYEDGEAVEFEKYSYTSYDDLSRIDQVGELWTTPNIEDQHTIESDPIDFDEEINRDNYPAEIAAYRKEVTRTVYDVALDLTYDPPFGASGQQNLRKRISSVYYEDAYDGDINTYNHATHYSYDIHGNVHTIIQDNPTLFAISEQFKTIKYEFDLISGNVNKVIYQDGDVDRFYHKYFYDADNRISEVYTSRDNIIWERDAKYFYYRHGPLARAEVGDLIVQGVDYAYTIHGWLKGVNAGALNATRDMGGDGQGSNYRKNIGIDAFGFILDYYEGDYTQINSGTNSFIPAVGTSGFSDVTANLFNGNIRAMTTAIMQTTVTSNKHVIAPTLGKAYRYDQLNRLTESLSYEKSTMHQTGQFTWAGVSSTNKWATKYAYDANGNILSMLRAGNLGGAYDMDSLTYSYNSNNNQLQYVTDDVGDGVYTDIDVDNQDVDNYIYDEIGNMISDDQGEINAIAWNVYGKITSIDKVSGADLEFAYDATGNRISKKVIESGQPTKTTYYVRDAQGNVMAVYTRETTTGGSPTDTLFLSEQHIYGSSRLGYVQTKVKMTTTISTSGYYSRVLGEKSYELSNHLGNVLAVVSDRRFAVEGSGATAGKIKYFEPDVLLSQDYDPFGMITFGRSWEVGSEYRYGFNTQEQDDEVYGNGNLNTAEFWEYDTRLGRRWNIDIVYKNSCSNYLAFGDNPIINVDYKGNDWYKNNNYDSKKEGSKEYEWFEGSSPVEGYEHIGEYFVEFNSAESKLTIVYQTGNKENGDWTANIDLNSDDGFKYRMLLAEGGWVPVDFYNINKTGRGVGSNEANMHRETKYGLLVISMSMDNRKLLATKTYGREENKNLPGNGNTYKETVSEGYDGISSPAYKSFGSWYKTSLAARSEKYLWSYLGDAAYANWNATNKFINTYGDTNTKFVVAYCHNDCGEQFGDFNINLTLDQSKTLLQFISTSSNYDYGMFFGPMPLKFIPLK